MQAFEVESASVSARFISPRRSGSRVCNKCVPSSSCCRSHATSYARRSTNPRRAQAASNIGLRSSRATLRAMPRAARAMLTPEPFARSTLATFSRETASVACVPALSLFDSVSAGPRTSQLCSAQVAYLSETPETQLPAGTRSRRARTLRRRIASALRLAV